MTRPEKGVEAYMPLWISDYLGDTTRLTYPLHGAYLLLLMTAWREGGALPDNDDDLAAIIGAPVKEWRKDVRPRLERFFRIADGLWRHKRVDEELSRAKAIRARKAEAGAKGAASRWQTDGTAIAEPLAEPMAEASLDDAISPSPPPVSTDVETIFPASRRKSPGTPLPSDWGPTDAHRQKSAALGVDCDFQAEKFKAWAEAKDARNVKWDRAFDNWLLNSKGHGNGGKQGQYGRGRAAEQWDARRRGAALSAGYRCGPDGVWYAPDGSVVGDPAGEGATPGH